LLIWWEARSCAQLAKDCEESGQTTKGKMGQKMAAFDHLLPTPGRAFETGILILRHDVAQLLTAISAQQSISSK